MEKPSTLVPASQIYQSYRKNKSIVTRTKLQKSSFLSKKYKANVYLKRQDLQPVRSFKLRGAATAFHKLTQQQKQRGVISASAGNHAQGIAYCCRLFKTKGTIFMPSNAPKIKVNSVKRHGGEWLSVQLIGSTFDEANSAAKKFRDQTNGIFIHAFQDPNVVEGQGGLAAQILEDWTSESPIDHVFTCVGGGGLASGLGSYFTQMAPQINIIGFEPLGSPSMYNSLKLGQPITLQNIDTFTDGACIRATSSLTFSILQEIQFQINLVHEGLVSKTILEMYDEEALVLEPAGSLAVAGLELKKDLIVGKTVICIVSGSNNDISRLPEIRLRSAIYQCKQGYYVLTYPSSINVRKMIPLLVDPQTDDIIFINSAKKFNDSASQCLIGLSFSDGDAKDKFQERVKSYHYKLKVLQANDPLLKILL